VASGARRRALGLAAAAACGAAAAGCGGDGDGRASSAGAEPLGDRSAGSVVQFADCGDWNGGTRAERLATIAAIRGRLTPERSRTAASPLTDERAYTVFENACGQGIDSLRLYKLYVKVQGFAPLDPQR
jgi:hypothetical protein